MIKVKFDLKAIAKNPSLNTLTWEVINARGLDIGDTAALWNLALDMGQACASCSISAEIWHETYMAHGDDETPEQVSQTYELLAKYLANDAREIVKFLMLRGFDFPEEHIGDRPDNAMEL